MPELMTLQQASAKYGVPYQLFKKHVERGKVIVERASGRPMVSDEAMTAYVSAEKVGAAVESMRRDPDLGGFRDLGNVIANLDQHVRDAILNGIPLTGKSPGPRAGTSAPFTALPTRGTEERNPLITGAADPHYLFPIGHRFSSRPKWERIDEATWRLGDATYTFTGFGWEGGGSAAGKVLGEGISPAHPDAQSRPLGPKEDQHERSGRSHAAAAAAE